MPVLGTLFRSASFEKNETELAIIVTPHLVQPARPGQHLRVPTDATVAANDIDRFLNGKQDLTQEEARGGPPARVAQGHILDLAEGDAHVAR